MSKEILPYNIESQFNDVLAMIEKARTAALRAVNSELIDLYWNLGKYINAKIESAEWGDSVVDISMILGEQMGTNPM